MDNKTLLASGILFSLFLTGCDVNKNHFVGGGMPDPPQSSNHVGSPSSNMPSGNRDSEEDSDLSIPDDFLNRKYYGEVSGAIIDFAMTEKEIKLHYNFYFYAEEQELPLEYVSPERGYRLFQQEEYQNYPLLIAWINDNQAFLFFVLGDEGEHYFVNPLWDSVFTQEPLTYSDVISDDKSYVGIYSAGQDILIEFRDDYQATLLSQSSMVDLPFFYLPKEFCLRFMGGKFVTDVLAAIVKPQELTLFFEIESENEIILHGDTTYFFSRIVEK